jgi:serine/threonine-protein kinase
LLDHHYDDPIDRWAGITHFAAVVVFLLSFGLLARRRLRLSARQLDLIEFSCLIATGAFFLCYQLADLNRFRAYLPGHADRELDPYDLVNDGFVLRWFIMIVFYGIFVPNTKRWCTVAIVSIAAVAIGTTAAFGWWEGQFREVVGPMVEMAVWLGIASATALFGLHIVNRARTEVHVGPYQLSPFPIGDGGMGTVYQAEHRAYEHPVAIKIPHDEFVTDPEFRRQFQREAEALAAVNHPHLVHVFNYDAGADGVPYLVMELLAGMNLYDFVRDHRAMSPERTVFLLLQLCSALGELHAGGLVHRDVKPNNILLCKFGDLYDFVKLLDLGIAHPTALPARRMGTPPYMSPEQARPGAELDGRSDIFSLGAVAYFLLTERSPFARETADGQLDVPASLDAVQTFDPPPPAMVRPDVPAPLSDVVMRCLQKDPAQRFQTIADLTAALEALQFSTPWSFQRARAWWAAQPVR